MYSLSLSLSPINIFFTLINDMQWTSFKIKSIPCEIQLINVVDIVLSLRAWASGALGLHMLTFTLPPAAQQSDGVTIPRTSTGVKLLGLASFHTVENAMTNLRNYCLLKYPWFEYVLMYCTTLATLAIYRYLWPWEHGIHRYTYLWVVCVLLGALSFAFYYWVPCLTAPGTI